MAASPVGIAALQAAMPSRMLTQRFARLSVRCAQIPVSMATEQFISRAQAAGLQVHVWTVNEPDLMATLLDRGADGIMTDQIEALRDVLIGRGEWHPRDISGI
jgi:glycerophosphoryl diester phosphodiesterase